MANIAELIHGRKPDIAPFIPTDPLQELYTLLSGEIKDWPQIQQLGDMYQANAISQISNLFPEFRDIVSQGGKDAQNLLTSAEPLTMGIIPEDVRQQVFRDSAFTSLGSGTLFGGMGRALTARDLGTTSLGLMSQGAQLLAQGGNSAQLWDQIAQGTMLPASSQLYDPSWFSQFEAQQRAAQQVTKQEKYNVAAAPDPVASGIAGTVMNLVGAYLGHGMGGGGNIIPNTSVQGSLGGAGNVPQAGANTGQSTLWQKLMGSVTGNNPAYTNVGGPGYGGYQFGAGQNPIPGGAMGAYDPSFNYGGYPVSSLDMYGTPG
jgi:hypothetical protein